MKKINLLVLSVVFFLMGKGIYADHYYGRYDDRSHRQYKPYYHGHENESFTQTRSYGYHSSRSHSGYNNYGSEGYYSCPRGDYISDRPGRCPLDGSALIPRGSPYQSKQVYSESYDRYY
jgi:hypothetical protein